MKYRPSKIISGGQTGVDVAALDWAIENGIQHGGWCPKGRLCESGKIPPQYLLDEIDRASYPIRTRMNVRDSDATLILYRKPMGAGTALTLRCSQQADKPHLAVLLTETCGESVADWIGSIQPETLNIAGPRESSHPGIYDETIRLLKQVF